jgi:hypothetical protein
VERLHARLVSVSRDRVSIVERARHLAEYTKIAGDLGTKLTQIISKLREWFPHDPS